MQRDDRRHAGGAHVLQHVAIVCERRIIPRSGFRFEPRPRKRESKCAAAELPGEIDVFFVAIPEVRRFAARGQTSNAFPHVADIVLTGIRFTLMIRRRNSEAKLRRKRR